MLADFARRLLVKWDDVMSRMQDEDGQTLAEYGLILAIVAVSVVTLAVVAFRGAIVTAFNAATGCLDGTC
jgi:Flp pilus assembly pilin Flp